MTDHEKVEYFIDLWDQLAEENPYYGQQLVSLLPESEVDCLAERLPGEKYEAFLASNLERGFGRGLHDCFSAETHIKMFIAFTEARILGELSEETAVCLDGLGRQHPHLVEVFTTVDAADRAPEEFAELGADGLLMFRCMNEEEVSRAQGAGAQSLGE